MRVLVVDDSTLFRKVVRDALNQVPEIEVVGSAANGRIALEKIKQLRPDVVTLDIEMPELDGLGVLQELQSDPSPPKMILLSALTSRGAELTSRALQMGAFDFILKPDSGNFEQNTQRLREELLPKVAACCENETREPAASEPQSSVSEPAPPMSAPAAILGIGISTGGPAALSQFLPKLPEDFPVPVVIVQHMPPMFTLSLAEDLDRSCPLHVQEGKNGQPVVPGNVFIAPGGKQMKVVKSNGNARLRITDDTPEKNCKPSVDYLFRSLAECYGNRTLAVVMTGMGDDGTVGCRLLKRSGAMVLAQDERSCVVYGMPRRVVEAGLADEIVPLQELSHVIVSHMPTGVSACH